jgi:pantothenate kinase-related protein Tda10
MSLSFQILFCLVLVVAYFNGLAAFSKEHSIISFSNEVEIDDKVILHEEQIEKILLHPEVAQRKVVIISILGALREGKSFLLNYLQRFLYAKVRNSIYQLSMT